jgi:hypothetical protein
MVGSPPISETEDSVLVMKDTACRKCVMDNIAFFPVNKSAGKTIWTMKVAASRQYDAGHIPRSFQ